MQPPEMAVFSFIDLPDVLTNKKGEHIMNKEYQRWVLINKQGQLVGRLSMTHLIQGRVQRIGFKGHHPYLVSL